MAAALFVSAETLKTHTANIPAKLQARESTHTAVIGIRLGLVSWEPA
jgi:DNA-binding NarL/FixJ family response regulator